MYHKTDHKLNQQIKDLSRIKIPITFKKILFAMIGYLLLLPAVIYLAITSKYDFILYIYLIPLAPIISITYLIFTGKLKWIIRIAHKLFHSKD